MLVVIIEPLGSISHTGHLFTTFFDVRKLLAGDKTRTYTYVDAPAGRIHVGLQLSHEEVVPKPDAATATSAGTQGKQNDK